MTCSYGISNMAEARCVSVDEETAGDTLDIFKHTRQWIFNWILETRSHLIEKGIDATVYKELFKDCYKDFADFRGNKVICGVGLDVWHTNTFPSTGMGLCVWDYPSKHQRGYPYHHMDVFDRKLFDNSVDIFAPVDTSMRTEYDFWCEFQNNSGGINIDRMWDLQLGFVRDGKQVVVVDEGYHLRAHFNPNTVFLRPMMSVSVQTLALRIVFAQAWHSHYVLKYSEPLDFEDVGELLTGLSLSGCVMYTPHTAPVFPMSRLL